MTHSQPEERGFFMGFHGYGTADPVHDPLRRSRPSRDAALADLRPICWASELSKGGKQLRLTSGQLLLAAVFHAISCPKKIKQVIKFENLAFVGLQFLAHTHISYIYIYIPLCSLAFNVEV